MNDPLDNLLDARLRDETPYIDDAGFTARVMQQLPHLCFSWSAQRAFIIFAATIVSVVIAYFASGEGMFVHDAFARMSGLKPMQLLLLILACGTGMTIAGLWAALARTRDTTVSVIPSEVEGSEKITLKFSYRDSSTRLGMMVITRRKARALFLCQPRFAFPALRRFRIFSP